MDARVVVRPVRLQSPLPVAARRPAPVPPTALAAVAALALVAGVLIGTRVPASARLEHVVGSASPAENDLTLSSSAEEVALTDGSGAVVATAGPGADVRVVGANGADTTLRVDLSDGAAGAPARIDYDGGAGGFDTLALVGDGRLGGRYLPSATTFGDGVATVGPVTVRFSGLEPVDVSSMGSFILTTPGDVDVVRMDAVDADTTMVSGSSDGVPFESVTLTDVDHFSLALDTNDGSDRTDTVTVRDPVVGVNDHWHIYSGNGTGLLNVFTEDLGADLFWEGGVDIDTIHAIGDVDWTLTDALLTSSGGAGTADLTAVDKATLEGDESGNTIDASGFNGGVKLLGRKGRDTVIGGQNSDSLKGGYGNDLVNGDNDGGITGSDDEIVGGRGNDTCDGDPNDYDFGGCETIT